MKAIFSLIKNRILELKIGNEIRDCLWNGNNEKAISIFKEKTGKNLHIASDWELMSFSITPKKIIKYLRKNKFPDDIDDIVIGHGSGTVLNNSWKVHKTGEDVFSYVNRVVGPEKKTMVFCCETTPKNLKQLLDPKKPGIGKSVYTELTSRKHPAKIVKNNEIIGDFACGKTNYYLT